MLNQGLTAISLRSVSLKAKISRKDKVPLGIEMRRILYTSSLLGIQEKIKKKSVVSPLDWMNDEWLTQVSVLVQNDFLCSWNENPRKREDIIGIINTKCLLLNYLIMIAKFCIWGCRRRQNLPSITSSRSKVNIKYELRLKTNSKDTFNKKWTLSLGNVPL